MAGGGARSATDRGDQIEIAVLPEELRAFGRVHLDDPVIRVTPQLVCALDQRAIERQPVIGKSNAAAAVEEEVTLAVFADDMARIDARYGEIDRCTPARIDAVRMH